MNRTHSLCLALTSVVSLGLLSFADPAPAAFRVKVKNGSWDAWNKKMQLASKQRPSITWRKFKAVQPGLELLGRYRTRTTQEIAANGWSIDAAAMDRDYIDFEQFGPLLPEVGAKHARVTSGWAKTEQKKGVYDFAWIDRPIREMAKMGIRPWVTLCYGNPVYGSEYRLGTVIKPIVDNPEALAAWLKYVETFVARYKDVVSEYEIWNEAFYQDEDYAKLFYETAKVVKSVQPEAEVWCTAVNQEDGYIAVLELLKKNDALNLADRFIFHSYNPRPEDSIPRRFWPIQALVKRYSPKYEVMCGESGCPGQLEYAHAMCQREWTEYSQAKWVARRLAVNAAYGVKTSLFCMIDLQYSFMLQSFGLVRSNTQLEAIYRRPSFFVAKNMFNFFSPDVKPLGYAETKSDDGKIVSVARFRTGKGAPALLLWHSEGAMPTDAIAYAREEVTVTCPEGFKNPVLMDIVTGRVFKLDPQDIVTEGDRTRFLSLPLRDCPVLVTEAGEIPLGGELFDDF